MRGHAGAIGIRRALGAEEGAVMSMVLRQGMKLTGFGLILGLAGALVGTLIAGAGITALVVGFAAKATLANLIAGLSLAVYRPFRIGEWK